MPTLRCPQCGAVNRDDAVDFPLCRQCNERLVQCGYCRQFHSDDPDGAGTCRSEPAGGPRPAGADDAPDCPHFQSRYLAHPAGDSRVPIHPAAWILGLIAVVFVVLFALSAMVRPADQASAPVRLEARAPAEAEPGDPPALAPVPPGDDLGARLRLDVQAPYPVQAGDEFTVLLTARNVSAHPTGKIRLGIPLAFLQAFRLGGLDPAPAGRLVRQGRRWFLYPSLAPGEWLRVRVRLTAPGPGEYEFQARLEAPNLRLPDQVPAPLRVVGSRPSPGAERGNST